jgi:hypothetical protein
LAKYLSKYGWHPIILTQKSLGPFVGSQYELIEVPFFSKLNMWKTKLGWNENNTIIEQRGAPILKNGKSTFERLVELSSDMLIYPDEASSWIDGAILKIDELVMEKKIDAIISTSGPSSSHIIARKIKEKYGIPWIADFRDMWSQNHYTSSAFRKMRDIVTEKIVISNADLLTTVSEPLANQLRTFHKGKKTISILNGYDPDDVNPGVTLNDKFSFIHTGSLYRGKRDPEPLFIAIEELIKEEKVSRNDIIVDFYGPSEEWINQDILNHGLSDIVKIHGKVPRDDVISFQRISQVLIMLTWNNPEEQGVYTGKLFEYIASRRPILLIGLDEGVAAHLINDMGIGKSASTVDAIKERLIEWYSEYRVYGKVQFRCSPKKTESLSQIRMSNQFADALDKVTFM